jgi:toxin ParE1/3/4
MRIVRAEQARIDTFDIWDYIAIENSAAVADGVLARISGALEVLAFAPMIGRKRTDLRGQPRSFSVRPYTVIYEPLPDGDGIFVWRIVHGARDLKRIIKQPKETK